MIPCILFPYVAPISQVNAFVISAISFPLFAFYASRYDEKEIIPLYYLLNVYSQAKNSLKFDGTFLFIGRLFVLGFMALLMYAAILLGLLNAGDMANDIAIYAYYSLVLGVTLIALSSWGRREVSVNGKKVERSFLDSRLSSAYHFLKTIPSAIKAISRSSHLTHNQTTESIFMGKDTTSEILTRHELLSLMEEVRSRLDAMQISNQQLEEIKKRLARIEEKPDIQAD